MGTYHNRYSADMRYKHQNGLGAEYTMIIKMAHEMNQQVQWIGDKKYIQTWYQSDYL